MDTNTDGSTALVVDAVVAAVVTTGAAATARRGV
jgi:hypothetical protein